MSDTPIIEKSPCTRCGGSGHFSYNQINGTTCFKCGGSGNQLTKRGKAVKNWVLEKLKTDALSVSIGDRVKYEDPLVNKIYTFTISDIIENEPMKGMSLQKDGTYKEFSIPSVTLVTTEGKKYSFSGKIPLHYVVTDELKKEAAKYRDSLTLAGKPRKK